jgi:alkylation response protein AidB-like acyl-CoA dehydrogenase
MTDVNVEDIDSFRRRARAFVQSNLGPSTSGTAADVLRNIRTDDEELATVEREREVQRMLFEAGLAGVCFPREYGGQGLTPTHQKVLNEELLGYEFPSRFQAPTMSPCAAVILDYGTEEQKQSHIPAILRGEELWMQFLSEPSGGSDVAGALTTAVRDGDEWVLKARRSGRRARGGLIGVSAWPGPIGMSQSTGDSRCSSFPFAKQASTSIGSRC